MSMNTVLIFTCLLCSVACSMFFKNEITFPRNITAMSREEFEKQYLDGSIGKLCRYSQVNYKASISNFEKGLSLRDYRQKYPSMWIGGNSKQLIILLTRRIAKLLGPF